MTKQEKQKLARDYISPFVRLSWQYKKARRAGQGIDDISLTDDQLRELDALYKEYKGRDLSPEIRQGMEIYRKIRQHNNHDS